MTTMLDREVKLVRVNESRLDEFEMPMLYTDELIAENLNKQTFTTNDLSDDYYYKKFGIKRLIVSTYQAVSGAGLAAINELKADTEAYLNEENDWICIIAHKI